MRWANFLHIYQPIGQQKDILEAVVVQSYRPIIQGLLAHPHARMTFNISGSLLELFDTHGYHDLLGDIRTLLDRDQIEITGSAKYHALLPFLPVAEMKRQIEMNTATLRKYFGETFTPKGFFPPEMAYSAEVGNVVSDLGFEWIILDEIAKDGKTETVDYTTLYNLPSTNLLVFFRERRPSNLIMSAVVRSYTTLKDAMQSDFASARYLITGMDGETFGHHRPGLEKLLFEMWDSTDFAMVQISDLAEHYMTRTTVTPVASTWASSEEDIEAGNQFLSWRDPENEIHTSQWELVHLALAQVSTLNPENTQYQTLREQMDAALASDHFWWASARPWWSIEEIERGAYLCLAIIEAAPATKESIRAKARDLYETIIATAFAWKREGKIYHLMEKRKNNLKIPFKERTFEKGGVERGVYEGFMATFLKLEKHAASIGEYEKAIIWRDAIYKIEHKTDIYDLVNAIELLRVEIPNEKVEKILDTYTEKYKKIRGGQPEQR